MLAEHCRLRRHQGTPAVAVHELSAPGRKSSEATLGCGNWVCHELAAGNGSGYRAARVLWRQSAEQSAFILVALTTELMIEPATAVLNDAALDWLDLIGRTSPGADKKAWKRRCRWSCVISAKPGEQGGGAFKPLVAKQTLHFSPGGGGVQRMRDEYQDGCTC